MASKKLSRTGKAGTKHLKALYLRQVLEDMPKEAKESLSSSMESTAGGATTEAAVRAIESFEGGKHIGAGEREILEAIVVPYLRPVYDVQNDSYEKLAAPWTAFNVAQSRGKMEAAIRAVGRVEVMGLPGVPYGGTGSIVGPNIMMTNRHVAELFSPSVGATHLVFRPGRTAALDLKQEVGSNKSLLLKVKKILLIHPHWDAAFLEVAGLPADRKPLQLAATPPTALEKYLVAVIGYPAFDSRSDAGMQMTMFRGVFQKKRLLPGYTRNFRAITSFGHSVDALTHDCSTLGGNSGSAVIDPKSGNILGLHFAGLHLEANFAVPAWELAKDPRVVDLGVAFTPKPAKGTAPPAWLKTWDQLPKASDLVPEDTAPTTKPATKPTAKRRKKVLSPEVAVAEALPADWFERSTSQDIARALEADPEATSEALRQVLGAKDAQAVIDDLTPPSRNANQEGLFELFDPAPDPNLPEIIWVHGIMGGHLARPGFLRDRIWMDLKELPFGAISKSLALAEDGTSEASGRRELEPDGMMQLFYAQAERTWRKQRFVVHPFSFDWRKSVEQLADRLHLFIQQLRQQRPRRQFCLVAHSMGGLVSSMYAQRHPEWRDAILRAIFMGSPLGGSYAPVQAGIGTYDLLRKLTLITVRDTLESMRRMAASLPGLMDMLPNPALFPDAEDAYGNQRWPDAIAPAQRWLDQSRNLKSQLIESPLLTRTTLLVTTKIGTVGSLKLVNGTIVDGPATAAGDGTVPAKAAVIAGVPAFHVDYDHSKIPKDPKAIQAVIDLAKNGVCNLPPVKPTDVTAKVAAPESLEIPEAALEGIATRHATGQMRAADVEWIFSPGVAKLPKA